jgi:hypothetical protein
LSGCGNADAGDLTEGEFSREMLGHVSAGFDGVEINDFHQHLIRMNRLADGDIDL